MTLFRVASPEGKIFFRKNRQPSCLRRTALKSSLKATEFLVAHSFYGQLRFSCKNGDDNGCQADEADEVPPRVQQESGHEEGEH